MDFPKTLCSYFSNGESIDCIEWVQVCVINDESNKYATNPLYRVSEGELNKNLTLPDSFPQESRYDDLCLCVKKAKREHVQKLRRQLVDINTNASRLESLINQGEDALGERPTRFYQNRYNTQANLYYRDEAIDDTLESLLSQVIKENNLDNVSQAMPIVIGAAYELIHNYEIHRDFGDSNLGGCTRSEEWLSTPIKDNFATEALRPHLATFIKSNIVPQEFAHEVMSSFYNVSLSFILAEKQNKNA